MKLSIALCTYNGAAYLPQQLESLATQSRLPDELIVCDDNSTDGRTAEIVRTFARSAPFEVRLSVNRQTLGSTRNFAAAITLCRGEAIFLCDQDDVWHEDKLARMEAAFTAAPEAGFVFSNAEVVDEDLRSLSKLIDGRKENFPSAQPFRIFPLLLPVNRVTGATMAFRSTFSDLVLPIPLDTVFQHDGWIALIIAAVAPAVFLDEPLIKYRQHSAQQIGVSVPASQYQERQSSLISRVQRHAYPNGEIHAFKTAYARLITKGPPGMPAQSMTDLRNWIIRLEDEKARLANARKARFRRRGPEAMKQYLDSRVIRVASYIWKDLARQQHGLGITNLGRAARTIGAHLRSGIKHRS